MIKSKDIPSIVEKVFMDTFYSGNDIASAFAAALNAWPSATSENRVGCNFFKTFNYSVLILPLFPRHRQMVENYSGDWASAIATEVLKKTEQSMTPESEEAFLQRIAKRDQMFVGDREGLAALRQSDLDRILALATRGTVASRNELVEEAAKAADGMSQGILQFYNRPGSPPGNLMRAATPSDIAAAIRTLKQETT